TTRAKASGCVRKITLCQLAHRLDFRPVHFTTHLFGRGMLTIVMPGQLHTLAEIRKPVETTAAFDLPEVNRAMLRLKAFRGRGGCDREQTLRFALRGGFQVGDQRLPPGAGREDGASR